MLALAVAVTACVTLSVLAVRGRRAPMGAVELSFPLRSGTYLVVNGGGNELINADLKTLVGERFRPWRGQSYGADPLRSHLSQPQRSHPGARAHLSGGARLDPTDTVGKVSRAPERRRAPLTLESKGIRR